MKIWAVFKDNYEDRTLCAIFSTKEAAEQFQRYLDHSNEPEEFELDSETPPDWWDPDSTYFACHRLNDHPEGFPKSRTTCSVYSPGCHWHSKPITKDVKQQYGGNLVTLLTAPDVATAQKIAEERFDRFIADHPDLFQL